MSAENALRTIRMCDPSDIDSIKHIAYATWPVAYADILSSEQLAYMLELMYSKDALDLQFEQGHHFFMIERNGQPLGFAGIQHDHRASKKTRLHKLYVLPGTQGSGAGKQLLGAVVSAARAANDTAIELNVNKFNPAKDFYLSAGFQIVRDEVLHIGKGYVMDDHVLEFTL